MLAGSKVPSISIEIDIFKHDGKWLIKHTYWISKAMPAEERPWRHHTTAQSQRRNKRERNLLGKGKKRQNTGRRIQAKRAEASRRNGMLRKESLSPLSCLRSKRLAWLSDILLLLLLPLRLPRLHRLTTPSTYQLQQ